MKDIAPSSTDYQSLYQTLSLLNDPDLVRRFLIDLCTPAELQAMVDRWRVVPLLQQNIPYRDIAKQTGVSVTTITRVARALNHGENGYQDALKLTGDQKI
jgi:TrpR-related protein YerC/YecD